VQAGADALATALRARADEAREELAEEAEELFDGLLKGRRGGLLDRIREQAPRGGGKRDIKKDKQDKEGRS
jgi:hypothetical protein